MRLNSFPHATEEYFCESCKQTKTRTDVEPNWECPKCKKYIQVRIKTEKLDNSCFRIPISELNIGDIVLMEREDEFREVLGLQESYKDKSDIRIALKEYGTVIAPKGNKILKLHGGWFN